ncbi:Hypothetical predicted protein [Olea europaea subsp. europaea]|uniref:Maternal effect embryo arrest 22 n=1 Tax=Olea europaea subsp. europaea TaxID=158383 RepID=A0A8S0R235_OLEEU|nr:Hypothetical predicted protein [Olea europaea subsp. europaea]
MAENVVMVKNEPSTNPCCTEWKKQYLKLQEKYSKLELRRNALREGISMVNEKFDLIEKENKVLKQALEGLKLQASKDKDEKEKESTMRVSLENEVYALKAELLSLRQNGNAATQEADGAALKFQESLAAAETEINRLKELLDKEIVRANLEKKNAEMGKKKADEALKKLNAEKTKVIKAKKLADIERKKAEESRLQREKLKTEMNEAKSKLASEMSKTEEANKKVESERQSTIQERKRADLAMAEAEELRKLAEMNLKKAMDEKGRVQQLSQILVKERKEAEKLEKDIDERMSSRTLGTAPFNPSERHITARNVEGKGEHCSETMKSRCLMYEELEKKLVERDHIITREKRRADSEMTKAEKQRKIAEAHKKEAIHEKHRANQLSRELEDNKQRMEQLQKELQELVPCRKYANSLLSEYNKVVSETATTKLLKKQLKFEKMLTKHAKKAARAEIGRSNMLRQELFQLKQESLQFQQRLDTLNDSFLHSDEGIDEVEKIGNLSVTRKHIGWNPYQMQYDGKNEIVTKPSSTASTPVMGSDPLKQNIERTTSLRPLYVSEYTSNDSNLEPTISRLSGETRKRYNPNFAAIAEDSVRSPIKGNDAERGAGHCKKRKRIDEAVESIENLYYKGQKLHEEVSEKLSLLHGILIDQKDDPIEENLQGNSCGKRVRRHKKRKSSCEEAIAIHPVHDASKGKSMIDNLEIREFDVCDLDVAHVSNACHQINVLCGKLGISDKSTCGNKKLMVFSENMGASTCDSGPKYCVVFSDNNDNGSICRILQTINCYMSQYSLFFSADAFLLSILLALLEAESLSSKEKVSVFFSLLLHRISECEMKTINLVSNDSVASLDTFSGHLLAVLSDVDLRRIFMESCNLFELLDLIEDFLLQRKVLVCGDLSSESMLECVPEMNPVINDNIKMSVKAASSHLLVAGAILLASLCKAVGHFGFVCETSCNILMMEKFDSSVLLTILHVFAHLCGSKYFNIDQYSVAMTVVKSLVMFLEKQNHSTVSTFSQSLVGTPSKIWSCSKCPFSEGSVSMDDVASLLLDKLQKYAGACVWPEDLFELVNLLVPESLPCKEKADEVSLHGEIVIPSSISDEFLHNFIDILSLFELVAFSMGWDWTFDNIICQLLVLLEAHVLGWFSIAIITLLGQLGRLGVNTRGYDDTGVEKLRSWLSSFLFSASGKLSISVQFATVNALFGVIPIKFEDLVENKDETTAVTSQSNAANCVRKWFFSLSSKQQSSFRLQAATMTNCKTGPPSRKKNAVFTEQYKEAGARSFCGHCH